MTDKEKIKYYDNFVDSLKYSINLYQHLKYKGHLTSEGETDLQRMILDLKKLTGEIDFSDEET